MKSLFLIFATLSLLIVVSQATHYAVLVAGSNYFYNYRHQSDIFHAYKLLTGYGIDAANIITFAYDDIANDPDNPFPGQVFNKPSTGPGEDVYKGVVIDYSGEDVTPENFLSVLEGNSTAVNGKKVLESTSSDNVFIYFADHGATGLIAFPNEYLYANDFIKTLTDMSNNSRYKEMVIYIEACESGSMFENLLPANISIYSTTAANSEESSWATYCPPDDVVNGTEIMSCLGDLYSVNFLENLESSNPKIETLNKQFSIILKETNQSHVLQFGDLSIAKERIGNFEGNNKISTSLFKTITRNDGAKMSVIDSRDVKLAYLQRKHKKFQSVETAQALSEEIKSIEKFDSTFSGLSKMFNLDVTASTGIIDFDCLKTRVAMHEEVCGKFSDYGLKYVKYISLTCSQGVDVYDYESAILSLCL